MKKRYRTALLLAASVMAVTACRGRIKTGDDLSAADIRYIEGLGLLSRGEAIRFFDSQSGTWGVEKAGNFITSQRLASYWIDTGNPAKTSINYAYFPDIDTLFAVDRSRALTYSSYLEVQRTDSSTFRVYVNADSAAMGLFFREALTQWQRARHSRQRPALSGQR